MRVELYIPDMRRAVELVREGNQGLLAGTLPGSRPETDGTEIGLMVGRLRSALWWVAGRVFRKPSRSL